MDKEKKYNHQCNHQYELGEVTVIQEYSGADIYELTRTVVVCRKCGDVKITKE